MKLLTLNQFIDNQMLKYGLKNNPKNRNKIRVKLTDILKNDPDFKIRKVWDDATTTTIDKAKTKQFKISDLKLLSQNEEVKRYFNKIVKKDSEISKEELQQLHKQDLQEIEDFTTFLRNNPDTPSEFYKNYSFIDDKALNAVMIRAIFNALYKEKEIDKKLLNTDLGVIWEAESYETFYDKSDRYFIAKKHLEHPEKYYLKNKKGSK